MNKKMFLPLLFTILTISIAYSMQETLIQHQNPRANANLFMFIETVQGKYMLRSGNTITNIGENKTCDRFRLNQTTSDYALYWISIGNVSGTLQTKTQLDSEYDRKQGSISARWLYNGDASFNVTYKWTFTETKNVNGAGSHWDSSGNNNMYACANFPEGAVTFNNNDNLTIRWVYTYDAN